MSIKRIGVTLREPRGEQFYALAEFLGKKPATLATEIILNFMKDYEPEIEKILRAKSDYEERVNEVRNDDEPLKEKN